MPELGSTSRKAGTSTREKMNESMPSMVQPPQAAQNARFWLDVSGTLAAEVSTTGLCMRGAGKKLDHRRLKKSRQSYFWPCTRRSRGSLAAEWPFSRIDTLEMP